MEKMATVEMERRALKLSELRVDGDKDAPKIVGYAAVFDSVVDRQWYREVVRSGAFTRSLKEGADVRALVNHDPSLILGKTAAGNVTLREDGRGLFAEITPPNTSTGRDTVESVRRGDLDGMSIGFEAIIETWSEMDKTEPLRELVDLELFDVSVVTYPAYEETDVALRSLDKAKQEQFGARNTTQMAENRLRLAEA